MMKLDAETQKKLDDMPCGGMFILDKKGDTPIKAKTFTEWAIWMEGVKARRKNPFSIDKRRVADQKVGESRISTVFLGLDHSFGSATPVLWETMVFGGPLDQDQMRCGGTRKDAKAMHKKMVQRVKDARPTRKLFKNFFSPTKPTQKVKSIKPMLYENED
jgi:hypothetical protein